MKLLLQKQIEHPRFLKAVHWLKLITITGFSQSLIQVIGLVSGILIIRFLSTQEYALYTLANTMLGTMMILTDSGISTGVMSQGSKVWQDREKLGIVLATGLDLRKKFAIVVLIIVTPVLLYLLRDHGASWLMSVLLVLSLIPSFLTSLSGTLLSIAPKLQQDIIPLQKNQISANVGRLVINVMVLFSLPLAFLTILASGLPQIWANIKLKKISVNYADWNQQPDSKIRSEILKLVKMSYPATIYFCIYSQINIWICSLIGSTDAVAQIGALSRLVLVLGILGVIFTTLITPRYSKLEPKKSLLLRRFFQIFFALIGLNLLIVCLVWLFPSEVLWILGKDYSNLTDEIILNVIGSCLLFLAGSIVALFSSRGWIMNPFIQIFTSLLALATGAALFNISTLKGIFIFNIYLAVIQVIMFLLFFLYKITRLESRNT